VTSVDAPSSNGTANSSGVGSNDGSGRVVENVTSARTNNNTTKKGNATVDNSPTGNVPGSNETKKSGEYLPSTVGNGTTNESSVKAAAIPANTSKTANASISPLVTNGSKPCPARQARNASELEFENKKLPHELVGMDDKLKVAFNEGYDAGRVGAGKKPIMVADLTNTKNISHPNAELSEAFLAGYNAGLASVDPPCTGLPSILKKASSSILSATVQAGRVVPPQKVKEEPATMATPSQSKAMEEEMKPDPGILDNAGRPALNTSSWVPANNVSINMGHSASSGAVNQSQIGAFTTVCDGVSEDAGESTNLTCNHPGQICTATIPLYVCQPGDNGTTWQVYKAGSTRIMNQSASAPPVGNNSNDSPNTTLIMSESEAAVNWHPTYRPVSTSPCGLDEERMTIALRGSEPCKQKRPEEEKKAEWNPPTIVKNVTDSVYGKKLPCTDCESQQEKKMRILGMPKLADVDFSANVDGKKELIKCGEVGSACEYEDQVCNPRPEHVDVIPKQQKCINGTWVLSVPAGQPTLCDQIGGCNKSTPIVEPHVVEIHPSN